MEVYYFNETTGESQWDPPLVVESNDALQVPRYFLALHCHPFSRSHSLITTHYPLSAITRPFALLITLIHSHYRLSSLSLSLLFTLHPLPLITILPSLHPSLLVLVQAHKQLLPEGWTIMQDRTTHSNYYYNRNTGESTYVIILPPFPNPHLN